MLISTMQWDPIDTIKAIIEIIHDQIIVSKVTIHMTKAQVVSETSSSNVLTAHAHRIALALGIDIHAVKMNTSVQILSYAT